MNRLPAGSVSRQVLVIIGSVAVVTIGLLIFQLVSTRPSTQPPVGTQPPDTTVVSEAAAKSPAMENTQEVAQFTLQRQASKPNSNGDTYQLVYVGSTVLPLTGVALNLTIDAANPLTANQQAKTTSLPKFVLESALVSQGWVLLLNKLDTVNEDQQAFALNFSAIRMSPQLTELAPNTVIATLQIPAEYAIEQLQPPSISITTTSDDQTMATIEVRS